MLLTRAWTAFVCRRYCKAANLREARTAFLAEEWAAVAEKLGTFVPFKLTDGIMKMLCRFVRVLDKNTRADALTPQIVVDALTRSNAAVASSLNVVASSTGGDKPVVSALRGLRQAWPAWAFGAEF